MLNRKFVALYIDMTDDESTNMRELTRRFAVVGEPQIIIMRSDGASEIARFHQFIPPRDMARALRLALEA